MVWFKKLLELIKKDAKHYRMTKQILVEQIDLGKCLCAPRFAVEQGVLDDRRLVDLRM